MRVFSVAEAYRAALNSVLCGDLYVG